MTCTASYQQDEAVVDYSTIAKGDCAQSTGFSRVVLTEYRSYQHVAIDLDCRPVILTGANGAGKTNFLEGLSMLSPGRGLRQASMGELRRKESHLPWAVAVKLTHDGETTALGTGLGHDNSDKRLSQIDGQSVSGPGSFLQYLSLAWLTPAMDRLFMEGATARRRFLDRMTLILHPDHGRTITAYERAMRERNALLETQQRPDEAWLGALESQMAEHGVAIAAARRDLVQQLSAHILAQPESAFPKAILGLEGVVETDLEHMSALEAEDAFQARLSGNRRTDQAAGRTLIGPHRSDLTALHSDKAMPAGQCSTGEQKALLVGLILAHADLGAALGGPPPILLLDEIAAHLDRLRRAALFERLLKMPAQCWLTGTDVELFDALEGQGQFFTVFDGQLHQ